MKTDNTERLCPNCRTGQDTYLLDSKNLFCPHIHCHNGESCSMFMPIEKENTYAECQEKI